MYLPHGLTLLVGPPGSGKTAFANRVTGRGRCGAVAIDDTDMTAVAAAEQLVTSRLRAGLHTVIDAQNLTGVRRMWTDLAGRFGIPTAVVRFDTRPEGILAANAARTSPRPEHEILRAIDRYIRIDDADLLSEGVSVVCRPHRILGILPAGFDGCHLDGPFDIVGDIHGQAATLDRLIAELGYRPDWTHPDGRLLVFVGDLVDKGPDPVEVLDTVMRRSRQGRVLVVAGNHEHTLKAVLGRIADSDDPAGALTAEAAKARAGRSVTLHGLAARPDWAAERYSTLRRWLSRLPLHLQLAGGEVNVVHAAVRPEQLGREAGVGRQRREAESWMLHGPTMSTKDSDGHRQRIDWIAEWDGPTVVRGHVTVERPEVRNGVVSVDTGAGDGRSLTAWSWPEKTFTTVDVVD